MAWRVQGQICAAQDRNADALRAFNQSIAICEALGSKLELANACFQRGALHRACDDVVSARKDWISARTLCEQTGARALLWQTYAVLGQLAHAQGEKAEADRAFNTARDIVVNLTDEMRDSSFRENLLSRAATLTSAE